MKDKPLTDEEIERAVRKIRKLYDDYIITYTKPFRLKNGFEDRYFQARKSRIDLTRFVFAELEVVRRLKQQAQDKLTSEEDRLFKRRTGVKRSLDLADRVIERHRKQIEKYPELPMDARASNEIKKLFGALDNLERQFWPPFESLLRRIYPSLYANPRVELEPRIYALCPGAGSSPPILGRYEALLLRIPRSQTDVEWEEKHLLIEAAFLLHGFLTVIGELPLDECTDEEREMVEKLREYVHTLITDFRFTDLKPTNLGG